MKVELAELNSSIENYVLLWHNKKTEKTFQSKSAAAGFLKKIRKVEQTWLEGTRQDSLKIGTVCNSFNFES